MTEENKNIQERERSAQGGEPNEDTNLDGYTEVETKEVSDSKVLENLRKEGIVLQTSTGERKITKAGDSAIVTEDFIRIFTTHGMQLSQEGEGYVVTFEDGTKQQVSEENAKKLIKNGVSGGDFVQVEGVRKTTEYEKMDTKKRLKALAALVIVPLLIMLAAKGCDADNLKDEDPLPSLPDQVPTYDEVLKVDEYEIEKVLTVIYGNVYSDIQTLLDPATVVRTAQDAYEAIDYDMELMGSDLCRYAVIQDEIVNPGAEFVESVSQFKEKYDSANIDSASYREMLESAKPLLEQQGIWIDTATGLVQRHAETTQECINRGLRVEDYTEEKKVTLGQIDELQTRKDDLMSFSTVLQNVDRLEEGLKNGTIQYKMTAQGDVIVFENEVPMVYKNQQTVKTQTNTVTGAIGGK